MAATWVWVLHADFSKELKIHLKEKYIP